MMASLIFLVAAMFMMPCAFRLRYSPHVVLRATPHSVTGPAMPQALHPHMHVEAISDYDISTSGWIKFGGSWIDRASISDQKFPPRTIYSLSSRRLLQVWARANSSKYDKATSDKGRVLRNMDDVIEEATSIFMQMEWHAASAHSTHHHKLRKNILELEMVGMIPKACLESGSSFGPFESLGDLDESVQALGVFSRETLQDDRRSSLRVEIEQQYGEEWTQQWWGLPKKRFDVFALEGIADASGLSESSARVLVSKIAEYARREQRVVVVPQHAYIRNDGTDLTQYYARLGFKKVIMLGRSQVLLYTGGLTAAAEMAAEDLSVLDQQIMVAMNLWTELMERS